MLLPTFTHGDVLGMDNLRTHNTLMGTYLSGFY
jgi:hypothetical protein